MCVARVRMKPPAQTRQSAATMRLRRSRRVSAFALVLAIALAGAVGGRVASGTAQAQRPPGTWCGGKLWHLMTLSDQERGLVELDERPTTMATLAKLQPQAGVSDTHRSWFERRVWRPRTVLDRYRVASNGEIVLVLYSIDSAQYMDAYLANPNCLSPATRARSGLLAARQALLGA